MKKEDYKKYKVKDLNEVVVVGCYMKELRKLNKELETPSLLMPVKVKMRVEALKQISLSSSGMNPDLHKVLTSMTLKIKSIIGSDPLSLRLKDKSVLKQYEKIITKEYNRKKDAVLVPMQNHAKALKGKSISL